MTWFDKLPAQVRHIVLLGAGAVLFTVASAVQSAGGATGVDWSGTGKSAVDAAAVVVVGALVLYFTSLTKQYGTGSTSTSAE